MFEIVYRYDPASPHEPVPQTSAEAKAWLERGNRHFATLLDVGALNEQSRRVLPLDPHDFGLGGIDDKAPAQEPFAAILGCADARVPTEIVFEQGTNDLFVVRVAGNVVGSECLGSLSYAVHHFHSLKLIAVIGHLHCGAVTAAVDLYMQPGKYLAFATNYPIQSIVNRISPSVRGAVLALRRIHGPEVVDRVGYRAALVELTVVLNAAWAAFSLKQELADREHAPLEVVFGVYDLVSRYVRLPIAPSGPNTPDTGLHYPPADERGFEQLADSVADGAFIRSLLG